MNDMLTTLIAFMYRSVMRHDTIASETIPSAAYKQAKQ